MNVERRYSKRYSMSGDIYIRYRKQQAFPAKVENGSLDGMYLKTKNLTLLTGALVELDMNHNGQNWQIMGVVAHASKYGLGVMFGKPQPEFYERVVTKVNSPLSNPGKGTGRFNDSPTFEKSV